MTASPAPLPIHTRFHAGRAVVRISVSAAGTSTTMVPLTHARWAESARWIACGKMPTPNSAPASNTRGRSADGSRRTRHMPKATSASVSPARNKNHANNCWAGVSLGSGHDRSTAAMTRATPTR